MERFRSILLFILMTHTILSAQDAGLNVQMQKIQDSPNWTMDLALSFDQNPGSGIIVELPAGVRAVPVSIRMDDREMWLKESSDPVTLDSAIHWERTDSTLVLRFNPNNAVPAGALNLRCLTQVAQKAGTNPLFTVKRMVDENLRNSETIATKNVTIAQ